jgi:hypothetical protein
MRYKDSTKAGEMLHHIDAIRSATQTVEQYCKEHGINKSAYYYWRKRFQKEDTPVSFVPVSINEAQNNDGVVMNFPNGVSALPFSTTSLHPY